MVKRYLIGAYGEHQHPSGDFVHWQDYQAICAELEQVKRERTINDPSEIRAANIRADAAERRAEKAERERVVSGRQVDAARTKLAEIRNLTVTRNVMLQVLQAAFAEPAGEVEPRQFLATEDGEFNGNEPVDDQIPIAATDGREVDWVDVTGWGVFKGHAIPVDVARYIATKINLYDEYRTTPPASAIREALADESIKKAIAKGLDGFTVDDGTVAAFDRAVDSIHASIRAALAGSAE